MSVLPITVLGAPILRQQATPVTDITDELQQLIDDMFDTMHAAQGIGLAAPQVARREALAVVEVDGARFVLINPEIVEEGGRERAEEGCLSIPEVYGEVERATRVVLRATGRDGAPYEVEASGLLARCFQHEIDHLHGKLFIDYLSFLKRRSAMAAWEGQKARYPDFLRVLTPEVVRRLRAEHAADDARP